MSEDSETINHVIDEAHKAGLIKGLERAIAILEDRASKLRTDLKCFESLEDRACAEIIHIEISKLRGEEQNKKSS